MAFGEEGEEVDWGDDEDVEDDGVAVGLGVLVGVVELVEDERKDRLNGNEDDGVNGKSMVTTDIHVHELDVRVEVEQNEAEDDHGSNNTEDDAGHDGIFIAIADAANIGAGRKWGTNNIIEILERVNE